MTDSFESWEAWYAETMRRTDVELARRVDEYRQQGVRVYWLYIHPDDESEGEPDLWQAVDHDTETVIQDVPNADLETFWSEHADWVEMTALTEEVHEQVKEDMGDSEPG